MLYKTVALVGLPGCGAETAAQWLSGNDGFTRVRLRELAEEQVRVSLQNVFTEETVLNRIGLPKGLRRRHGPSSQALFLDIHAQLTWFRRAADAYYVLVASMDPLYWIKKALAEASAETIVIPDLTTAAEAVFVRKRMRGVVIAIAPPENPDVVFEGVTVDGTVINDGDDSKLYHNVRNMIHDI